MNWRLLTGHRIETSSRRAGSRNSTADAGFEQLFRTIKSKFESVSKTAPFATLCAMTLVAGVSCMQMVQDRDGSAKRPLRDVFEAEDRTALEAVSATLEGKTEKQKNPHPKGSLAFAAWVCAETGYYENQDPSSLPLSVPSHTTRNRMKHDV